MRKFKNVISKLALGLIIASGMASCTIREEIHFNKDYSGNLKYNLDFSSFMTMAASFGQDKDSLGGGATESPLPPELSSEMISQKIEGIDGITDVQVDMNPKGMLSYSFNFKDLESLNVAYSHMNSSKNPLSDLPNMGGDDGGFTPGPAPEENNPDSVVIFDYFTKNKKELIYRRPQVDLDKESMQDSPMAGGMLQGMGEILNYKITFDFDRSIKKVKADKLSVENDKHTADVKLTLDNLSSSGSNPEISFKLK